MQRQIWGLCKKAGIVLIMVSAVMPYAKAELAKAVFFPHSNFREDIKMITLRLPEGGYNSYDLKRWGMHDTISSVRVPAGLEVTLFQHRDWTGKQMTLRNDAKSLGNFNDITSSIIVTDPSSDPSLKAKLYRDANNKGSYQWFGPGSFDVDDITVGNDSYSSARIPDGLLVVLFEHSRFRGKALGLDQSIPRLSSRKFNDKTSSVIVYSEADYEDRLLDKEASARQIADHPRVTSFDSLEKEIIDTDPVLIGDVLLPYIYVQDVEFPAEIQAAEFPYYILRREQYWKKLFSFDHSGTTESTQEKSYKVGVVLKDSKSTSTTETLTVNVQAELDIPKVIGIAPKLTTKIEKKLETKVTQSQETTRSESVERSVKRTFSKGARVFLAGWSIVDRYTILRLEPSGSETKLQVWEAIVPDHISEDSLVESLSE